MPMSAVDDMLAGDADANVILMMLCKLEAVYDDCSILHHCGLHTQV